MTSQSNDQNLDSNLPPESEIEPRGIEDDEQRAESSELEASTVNPAEEELDPSDATSDGEHADDGRGVVGTPAGESEAAAEESREAADQPESEDIEEEAEEEVESELDVEDDQEEPVDVEEEEEPVQKLWYILKVQVNREDSIRDALARRVKIAGLDEFFDEIVVPTEDVAEYNKSGKRRIVKRKLYPGYIMVHMVLNDDTWFLVRETPGIGDFTGSAGKPTPMEPREVQRIINYGRDAESGEAQVKTAIPFKMGEQVRVKEGNFLNFEGEVSAIDEANGRVTVMINIFGRSTPVELEHWQIESV